MTDNPAHRPSPHIRSERECRLEEAVGRCMMARIDAAREKGVGTSLGGVSLAEKSDILSMKTAADLGHSIEKDLKDYDFRRRNGFYGNQNGDGDSGAFDRMVNASGAELADRAAAAARRAIFGDGRR